MTDMLTFSGSQAARSGALRRFRRLFGVVVALHCVAAVAALLFPAWTAGWIGLQPTADATAWIRAWSGLMLVAALFQAPGLLDPIDGRIAVIIGIIARFGMALVYLVLGGAFLWLAAFEVLLAAATLAAFQSLIKAEIMTRP